MDKQLAKKMFVEGYSCAQAVACAFAEETGLSVDELKRLSIAFGGGFVKTKNLCGAMTGAGIVAGYIIGGIDANSKVAFTDMFESYVKEFNEKHGSFLCGDLKDNKAYLLKDVDLSQAPIETYESRPCLKLVLDCIDMLDSFLKKAAKQK